MNGSTDFRKNNTIGLLFCENDIFKKSIEIQGVQKFKHVVIARKPMVQLVSLPNIPFRRKMTDFGRALVLWEQKIHAFS